MHLFDISLPPSLCRWRLLACPVQNSCIQSPPSTLARRARCHRNQIDDVISSRRSSLDAAAAALDCGQTQVTNERMMLSWTGPPPAAQPRGGKSTIPHRLSSHSTSSSARKRNYRALMSDSRGQVLRGHRDGLHERAARSSSSSTIVWCSACRKILVWRPLKC